MSYTVCAGCGAGIDGDIEVRRFGSDADIDARLALIAISDNSDYDTFLIDGDEYTDEGFAVHTAKRCRDMRRRPDCGHSRDCDLGDERCGWCADVDTARKAGFYRCHACHEDFTVRTGTIFERSHVPLHKWLYAMYLLVTARKGISSLQLSKQIGVTQKTAWFMLHRIREACGNDLAEFFKRNSPALRREIDAVLKALLTPEAG